MIKATNSFGNPEPASSTGSKKKKSKWQKRYNQEHKQQIREYGKRYWQENKQKIREKNKKYRQKNKQKIRKKSKRYRQEHKQYYREEGRRYRQEHKQYFTEKSRERAVKQRKKVLMHYSKGTMQCANCGYNISEGLSIDHTDDDGAKHREEVGKGGHVLVNWLIKHKYPKEFQVLCWNCNFLKSAYPKVYKAIGKSKRKI